MDAQFTRRIAAAVSVTLSIVLASCGSGTDVVRPVEPAPDLPTATSVTLTPSALTLESIGATAALTPTARDQRGAVLASAPVSWTSSDPQIASVSASGVVTAVNNGTASITATSGTATATASVTVSQVPVSLTPRVTNLTLDEIGRSDSLFVELRDARGNIDTTSSITWQLNNPWVVDFTDVGRRWIVVTALRRGSTEIVVTVENLTASMTVEVRGRQIREPSMLSRGVPAHAASR